MNMSQLCCNCKKRKEKKGSKKGEKEKNNPKVHLKKHYVKIKRSHCSSLFCTDQVCRSWMCILGRTPTKWTMSKGRETKLIGRLEEKFYESLYVLSMFNLKKTVG